MVMPTPLQSAWSVPGILFKALSVLFSHSVLTTTSEVDTSTYHFPDNATGGQRGQAQSHALGKGTG